MASALCKFSCFIRGSDQGLVKIITLVSDSAGARKLIDLVRNSRNPKSRFYFCSSIASVTNTAGTTREILEEPSTHPSTASPIGYSQSKWVVERICQSAAEQSDLAGRVHILRIGQLCGDTQTGYWNEKEGWPLLIRTSQTTGCLPRISEVSIIFTAHGSLGGTDLIQEPSWLPVDLAAHTM